MAPARSFLAVLLVMLVSEGVMAPVTIVVDAAAMAIANEAQADSDSSYGKQRQWGAVGWGSMSAVAGWGMARFGEASCFALFAALAAMTLVPSAMIPWKPLHSKLNACQHEKKIEHVADVEETPLLSGPGSKGRLKVTDDDGCRTEQMNNHDESLAKGNTDAGMAAQRVHRSKYEDYEIKNEDSWRFLDEDSHRLAPGDIQSAGDQCQDGEDGVRLEEIDSKAEEEADAEQSMHPKDRPIAVSNFMNRAVLLVTDPEVLIFLAQATVMGFAVGTIEGFLFIALEDLNGTSTLMGLSLTFTCISETIVFNCSNLIIGALGLDGCFHVCFFAFVIRLMAYATMQWWSSIWFVLPVELLHGES